MSLGVWRTFSYNYANFEYYLGFINIQIIIALTMRVPNVTRFATDEPTASWQYFIEAEAAGFIHTICRLMNILPRFKRRIILFERKADVCRLFDRVAMVKSTLVFSHAASL